ncbi:MAG: hypothetical protein R3F38_02840 [Gammaproteobacteria bacterium]
MAIAAPLNTLVIFDSPQFFITFQHELSANNINLGACLRQDSARPNAWDIVLRPLHPDESGLAQWRQQSQARDRLHRVLDASPDIVFMLTLDGKLLYNVKPVGEAIRTGPRHTPDSSVTARHSAAEIFPATPLPRFCPC